MPNVATKKSAPARADIPSSPKAGAAPRRKRSKKRVKWVIWGFVFSFLTLLSVLALIDADGFFIRWYQSVLCGIIGRGFYITAPVFAICVVFFFTKKRIKIAWKIFSLLSLTVFAGALLHVYGDTHTYLFNFSDIGLLYKNGSAGISGGIIAGGFAIFMRSALSPFGAAAFIVLLMILALYGALNKVIAAAIAKMKIPEAMKEDAVSPGDYEHELTISEAMEKHAGSAAAKPRAVIDIPLDDGPKKAEGEQRERKKFFFSKAGVKTPGDILLQDMESNSAEGAAGAADLPDADHTTIPSDAAAGEAEVQDAAGAAFAGAEVFRGERSQGDAPGASTDGRPADQNSAVSGQDSKGSAKDEQSLQKTIYRYPPESLLNQSKVSGVNHRAEIIQSSERLIATLKSFGIEAKIINTVRGPTVTRYEFQISQGIRFARITVLSDDIALSLGASSVRIATIPDKGAIGIEVPNQSVLPVCIREILSSNDFKRSESRLSFAVGKSITGTCVVGDISKMPHMLIAGTTGSGKSVCINSIIVSLLYKSPPEEVRMIMIDPKMIELGIYNGIPHLLIPVVTDPKKASGALNWAVTEMLRRYKLFAEKNVRDLDSYNMAVLSGDEEQKETLPRIVIIIDELADLMFAAANEVEEAIARIAQMARAAGMHLIIATQRPSADVITGIMKANIPSRIAFAVASQMESRIILDTMGAEKLIGKGDMLYYPLGMSKPQRVQGCFITSGEVESVVEFVKRSTEPDYREEIIEHIEKQAREKGTTPQNNNGADEADELLDAAIEIVVESGQASVSMLQRRLKLGYSRAARVVDQMEERGIVGAFEGSKPRQVLISKSDWQEIQLRKKI